MKLARRHFVALLGSLTASIATTALAVKPADLVEPVHRVANIPNPKPVQVAGTPLDRALDIARRGLQNCRATVNDYTATLVLRESVNGTLGAYQYASAKVRNRKVVNGKLFSL